MTDQELQRLAALAAGYELKWSHEWPGGGNWNCPSRPRIDTIELLAGQKLLWEAV